MAEMISEFLPDGTSQGERRVFAALQSLPDDVVVYYEPVIRRRFPDFIVIAPYDRRDRDRGERASR